MEKANSENSKNEYKIFRWILWWWKWFR